MIDCHVHLEKGPYSKEWIQEFVNQAIRMEVDEIYLLEHTHVFREFEPLYLEMSQYNSYQTRWYAKKKEEARPLSDYLQFIESMRQEKLQVQIKFGLEVCYSPEHEKDISRLREMVPLDLIVGSIHWIDGWAFSHLKQPWGIENIDAYKIYNRYYDIMELLIESRLFDGLAHPNSMSCFGVLPPDEFKQRYDKIAKLLKNTKMYVEESSGLVLNYTSAQLGMNEEMLLKMIQYDVKIQTASDAHYPHQVGAYISEMEERIEKFRKMER